MQSDMDYIRFESRRELEALKVIMDDWLAGHKKDTFERDIAQEFSEHLEAMWFRW